MADFVPGQNLCRAFYKEVVAPKVEVPHSAGLLGPGSDVLGYDTERSTDHDWGPRCTVFVLESSVEQVRMRVLGDLPKTYRGWAIDIGRDHQPLGPQVEVVSLSSWLSRQVGWDGSTDELSVTDWLLVPQQRLLGLTEGSVFADPHQELARMRRRLAWYPEPVFWWLLACQWRRLAQEEPFVQRAAEAGDDLGSRVITGRLVRDCMRLALLLERRHSRPTRNGSALPSPVCRTRTASHPASTRPWLRPTTRNEKPRSVGHTGRSPAGSATSRAPPWTRHFGRSLIDRHASSVRTGSWPQHSTGYLTEHSRLGR